MPSAPRPQSWWIQKTGRRSVFVALVLTAAAARAETVVLDREKVVALARAHAPAARVAALRAEEARATRTGASALSQSNPDLAASVGPRLFPTGPALDVAVSLSWPLDFFGAPAAKREVAEQRVNAATSEQAEAERAAVLHALQLWAHAHFAQQRAALEAQRAAFDEELLRIAKVRRAAGAVGDSDVALSTVLQAESRARARLAESEREAALVMLRTQLGLTASQALTLAADDGEAQTPPGLDAALARLASHPLAAKAEAAARAEAANAELQGRLGIPTPRLLVVGERSPEYTGRLGLELPLPLFQRNQTETAVAKARAQTALLETSLVRAALEADLRAAHARWSGAREAFEVLNASLGAIEETEHLALRSYELGQGRLNDAVFARREAANARLSLLEARAALARSRLQVDLASGASP